MQVPQYPLRPISHPIGLQCCGSLRSNTRIRSSPGRYCTLIQSGDTMSVATQCHSELRMRISATAPSGRDMQQVVPLGAVGSPRERPSHANMTRMMPTSAALLLQHGAERRIDQHRPFVNQLCRRTEAYQNMNSRICSAILALSPMIGRRCRKPSSVGLSRAGLDWASRLHLLVW